MVWSPQCRHRRAVGRCRGLIASSASRRAQEQDVTTLAELTGASIPATSQQLAKLRAAGVVSARRDGRRQLYQVDDPHILSVINQMFSYIGPDGTLAPDPQKSRPARRPRFSATGGTRATASGGV